MIGTFIALTLFGVAGASEQGERAGDPHGHAPPDAHFLGRFDQAPTPHWQRKLPGPAVNAATHAERARAVVLGDTLLIGAAGGDALYRLSRRDGALLSEYPASASVESEPIVVGDLVYFTDTSGTTWCYRVDGGDPLWSHESGAPILVQPTVHEGVVYVTNVDDLAVALDAKTGELRWRYQRKPDFMRVAELALYAAPPAAVLGDLVLLGFSDGAIVALNRHSGELEWDRRVGEGRYPDIVAALSFHGDDLFAAGYFQPLMAIDRQTQNVRWRLDVGAAAAGTVADGVLYHPSTNGKLHAVITLTGAEQWVWDSGTAGALTQPVLTEAGFLVGSSHGGLYLVDLATGRELWRYHEPIWLEGVTSAPTVAGRQVLFVSNAGNLYSMLSPQADPIVDDDRWW